MSREAFESGRTKELTTICSFEEASSIASDENTEVVMILEKEELGQYRGKEPCLAFARNGDNPVLINGIIGAGRALLYRDMPRLLDILRELSGDEQLQELTAVDMEKLLVENRDEFTRRLIIVLPALIKLDTREMEKLNRAILEVIRAA